MLRMKKNFIGLALVASVLAGCQTAPKDTAFEDVKVDESTDFDAMFPGYGSDRRPASNLEPIFKELFEALSAASKGTHKFSKSGNNLRTQFVRFANNWKGEGADQLEVLRNSKRAGLTKKQRLAPGADVLTEKELEGLTGTVQARIADAFLTETRLKDYPSLSGVASKTREAVASLGKADATSGTSNSMNKLMTVNRPGAISAADQARVDKIIEKNQRLAESLNEAFNSMGEVDPHFKSPDGKNMILQTKLKAGKLYRLTGDSHLLPSTCENLVGDKGAALKAYNDMFDNILKDLDDAKLPKDPKTGRILCKNMAEMTAWSVAKYQSTKLGRTGLAAWTAVQEMTFCNYIKEDTAGAARKLASANNGDLGKMPECKQ